MADRAESFSGPQVETAHMLAEPTDAIMSVEEVYFALCETPEDREIGFEVMEDDCTRWLSELDLADWIDKASKDGTPMNRFVLKCPAALVYLFKLDEAVGEERDKLFIKVRGYLTAHFTDERIEK